MLVGLFIILFKSCSLFIVKLAPLEETKVTFKVLLFAEFIFSSDVLNEYSNDIYEPAKRELEKHNIKYEVTALPVGDYSFALDPCEEFGINERMYFHQDIIIEKKNSLEELSGCFTQTRERFNDEWSRCWAKRKFLLIENASYEMLVNGEYDTKYNSKSFLGSFHSFVAKYGIEVMFIKDKDYVPIWILGTLQYYLRYLLK